MADIGPARLPAKSLKTQFGRPSGPIAFWMLMAISFFSTSSVVIVYLSGKSDAGCWWVGVSLGRFELTD
jgi:hypothetical protein